MTRPAREEDCEPVARLAGQLGYPTTTEQARDRLQILLTSSEDVVFVAEDGGKVVGWIGVAVQRCVESGPFAEIMGLVVDESSRGKGIGERLVQEAESWAKSHGYSRLRVRSNVIRERAHRFYERLGYSKTKQQAVFDKKLA